MDTMRTTVRTITTTPVITLTTATHSIAGNSYFSF
jgi:hypothetical protein